jgi:guanylate cyclase soluble subunit beta
MRSYDDAITYQLVTSASEVLQAPVDACLELFGVFWVEEIAAKSFAPLMETTGTHTIDFLNNLNALHDRISSTFTNYVPPEFQVETMDETTGLFRVHYFSKRDGLTAFVVGLLRGLAKHFADELEIIGLDIHPQNPGTHSVFELRVTRSSQ